MARASSISINHSWYNLYGECTVWSDLLSDMVPIIEIYEFGPVLDDV